MISPLIFAGLTVPWRDISPPGVLRIRPDKLLATGLSTFPGPGHASSIEGVTATPEGLTFPAFGTYRLQGIFGAVKLLLIDPDAHIDDIPLTIASFLTVNQWHSGNDCYLCHKGNDNVTFHADRIMEKLFRSDQPLGLYCGYVSRLLCALLQSQGYEARLCSMILGERQGHMVAEVKLPDSGRWILLDADFGVAARLDGRLIGVEELSSHFRDGIEVVDLGPKFWAPITAQKLKGFHGQIAWLPSFMDMARSGVDVFRRNVLQQKMCAVQRPLNPLKIAGAPIENKFPTSHRNVLTLNT